MIINKEKKDIELDVVAESIDKKKILIGECKWAEGEQAEMLFKELEIKAQSLPFVKGREVIYALFLKRPAKDGITKHVFLPQSVINDFMD